MKDKLQRYQNDIERLAGLYNKTDSVDSKLEYSHVAGLIIKNSNFPDKIKMNLLERFLEITTRGLK